VPSGNISNNVQVIKRLPEPVHGLVLNGFDAALSDVFLWAVPVVLVALAVAFFIKEVPLKSREDAPEAQAAPEEVALSH
jgi:cytochrome c-type biogenesis protein CcmH/NrfF